MNGMIADPLKGLATTTTLRTAEALSENAALAWKGVSMLLAAVLVIGVGGAVLWRTIRWVEARTTMGGGKMIR